jgi:hypothetical protein
VPAEFQDDAYPLVKRSEDFLYRIVVRRLFLNKGESME